MPEPITRQETYLNAIVQNTGGGDGGSVPEPITREEQFLNQIVTNTAGGGGGGGSSLPAVTSDDNGDVLTVVEGQWAKAAPSGGVLVVSVDIQTMALDHTWQEINDAPLAIVYLEDGSETDLYRTPVLATVYWEEEDDVKVYGVSFVIEGQTTSFVTTSANGYPVMNGGEQ